MVKGSQAARSDESRLAYAGRIDAAEHRIGGRTIEQIRGDFPALQRVIRHDGRDTRVVYLDNAATTQKPQVVLDAMTAYYERSNANVHRALYTMGEESTAAYEATRRKVQRFINAASEREIVYTSGTTASINLVAYSWGRSFLKEGDEILLTEMEHHSNLVPWQLVAQERGCVLRFLPVEEDGTVDLDRLPAVWSERTRLVAIAHMSNVLGTVNDVKRIIEFAHARGVPVLLDGAQSVPHLPVDVQALDCDFLAFSGHKMCGPTGIGILYAKERLLEQMPPFLAGGEMIEAVWLDHATWNELPYKFEAGTPPIAESVGLGAAVDYLSSLSMKGVQEYEEQLTRYTLGRLDTVPGLTLYGRSAARGAVFSFNIAGVHPHDLAQFLDRDGVCVRSGHHCAHPLMRKLNVPATARASLSFYNTAQEVDLLVEALRKAKEFFI